MEQKGGYSKNFWLVVIGQIISLFGNAIIRFALPLYLLDVTGSPVILGVVSGCAFIPLAIMTPIGGMIADRVNKRNIMVFLDFFTSGITVIFLLLHGNVNVTGLILVTLFLFFGISGAYQPSVQASIPVLVKEERIMPANAIINMVASLSGLLGPALGGALYAKWGINPILYVAAACFLFSAVMEIFIHIPFHKMKREKSIIHETVSDLKSSICYITREKSEIGKLTLSCASVNLFMSALMIVGLPVIVKQVLDFSPEESSKLYGFLMAILSIGGLIGGMCAGMLSKKLKIQNSWKLLLISSILMIPAGAAFALNASSYVIYGVLCVSSLVIMAFASLFSIQAISYIQMVTPHTSVGKVIAWVMAVSTIAQPLGQTMYGFLFENLKDMIHLIFFISSGCAIMISLYSKRILRRIIK